MTVKIATLIIVLGMPACAQDQGLRFLLGASWLTARHSGGLNVYDPTAECGTYANGQGTGGEVRGGIAWPAADGIQLGVLLSARQTGATFVTRKSDVLVRDAEWALVPFVRDYTLTASLTQVAAMVDASFKAPGIPLWIDVGIGPEFRRVSQASQHGVVVSPSNVLFSDSLREHDLGTAPLPGVRSLGAAASLAACFELPLGRALRLVPELRATYSLSAITASGTWHPLSVSIGASVTGPLFSGMASSASLTPVIVTTIITTSAGRLADSDSSRRSFRFAAFEVADDGSASRPARVMCARVPASVSVLGSDTPSIDTIIVIPEPRSIAFAIGDRDSDAAGASWSITVLSRRDTLFSRTGPLPIPPVVLWKDDEIRATLSPSDTSLVALAAMRDRAGREIQSATCVIPITLVDSSASPSALHRYILKQTDAVAFDDALIDQLAGLIPASSTVSISATASELALARRVAGKLANHGIDATVCRTNDPANAREKEVIIDVLKKP